MISTWIGIVFFALCGIIGAILAVVCCESIVGKVAICTLVLAIAGALCGLLFWHLYYTESGKRAQKTFKSEVDGGLYRVVKVYDMEGEQLAEYNGKFDVEETHTEGVTKVKFDVGGERHIIYCSTGTVIIDEMGEIE